MNLERLTYPIVQISLDLTSIDEALDTAAVAVDAGVDWLEAGTPPLPAEGAPPASALRPRLPRPPIVGDLQVMDRGKPDGQKMARGGAKLRGVKGRPHQG